MVGLAGYIVNDPNASYFCNEYDAIGDIFNITNIHNYVLAIGYRTNIYNNETTAQAIIEFANSAFFTDYPNFNTLTIIVLKSSDNSEVDRATFNKTDFVSTNYGSVIYRLGNSDSTKLSKLALGTLKEETNIKLKYILN